VACMGEWRGAYRVLVGKHEYKRPLGRPRGKWGIILKLIFRQSNWEFRMWLGIRVVGGHL